MGCMAVVAHRKTAWPSWDRKELRSAMTMFGARSPALPQTTGPIPGGSPSGTGPTTAAPAPSAKMMEVARSSGSIHAVIFSEPMTSTCRAEPVRDHRGRVRYGRLGAAGGHDDQVDVGGGQAAAGQCLAAGRDRHVDHGLIGP